MYFFQDEIKISFSVFCSVYFLFDFSLFIFLQNLKEYWRILKEKDWIIIIIELEIGKFSSEIFFGNLASSSKVREIFGRCDIRGMSRDIIYRDDSDEFDDCYLEIACRLVYGFEDKILYCENNVWKEKRF